MITTSVRCSPGHQKAGERGEESPFRVGGSQPVRPAINVAATDKPSLREPLGGRKEAIDSIGYAQLAQYQGFRVRDDVTKAGLKEQRDKPTTDPTRREAVAPGVQDS